ncbi:MAG: hypothetical protein AAGF15_06655 [Pseudomonadota bacterium]
MRAVFQFLLFERFAGPRLAVAIYWVATALALLIGINILRQGVDALPIGLVVTVVIPLFLRVIVEGAVVRHRTYELVKAQAEAANQSEPTIGRSSSQTERS